MTGGVPPDGGGRYSSVRRNRGSGTGPKRGRGRGGESSFNSGGLGKAREVCYNRGIGMSLRSSFGSGGVKGTGARYSLVCCNRGSGTGEKRGLGSKRGRGTGEVGTGIVGRGASLSSSVRYSSGIRYSGGGGCGASSSSSSDRSTMDDRYCRGSGGALIAPGISSSEEGM